MFSDILIVDDLFLILDDIVGCLEFYLYGLLLLRGQYFMGFCWYGLFWFWIVS